MVFPIKSLLNPIKPRPILVDSLGQFFFRPILPGWAIDCAPQVARGSGGMACYYSYITMVITMKKLIY